MEKAMKTTRFGITKVIVLMAIVLTSNLAFAQNSKKAEKLSEKIAGEICECMCNKTDFESDEETMEVFMSCYLKSFNSNKKEIDKRVMKRKSGYAKMDAIYEFSISIGINLGLNCEQYMSYVTKNMSGQNKNDTQTKVFGPY